MRPITGIRILGFRLGVIVLAIYWGTLFTGTHWPAGPPIAKQVGDKTLHYCGFFCLAILCCYVTQSSSEDRQASVKRFGGIFLVSLAYAIVDEWTQSFSRGRYSDPYDVLADAVGALSAISLYAVAKYAFARFSGSHGVGDAPTHLN